jgi:transposase
VACIRKRVGHGQYEEQRETFRTFTGDLKRLSRWLRDNKVHQVAMESTGVYWMPVWNTLEPSRFKFDLTLVNPAQVRAMAGHKTDQIDSGRIAEFLQHGRLAGSFIPPPPVREARALERRRVHLQQDRNRAINRIGRLLQTASIKLSSVLSNIVGVSGRKILRAIAKGETNGNRLVELAHGSLSGKKEFLIAALEGCYSDHFRYMLTELLDELDHVDKKVAELTGRLELYMTGQEDLVRRLCTVPGIDKLTAWTILAEIGSDMSAFADAKHLASWVALCPGNNESGGKRRKGKTRKGNRYLKRAMVQGAWGAAHSKGTFLSALFFRLARRLGMKKAAVALAHRMLVIVYAIIGDGESYQEKGDDYFDKLHPARTAHRLMERLERLGYDTTRIAAKPAAVPDTVSASAPLRRQGRPCKCAERGILCTHRYAGMPIQPRKPVPLSPEGCRICGKWGIACIHLRPK